MLTGTPVTSSELAQVPSSAWKSFVISLTAKQKASNPLAAGLFPAKPIGQWSLNTTLYKP